MSGGVTIGQQQHGDRLPIHLLHNWTVLQPNNSIAVNMRHVPQPLPPRMRLSIGYALPATPTIVTGPQIQPPSIGHHVVGNVAASTASSFPPAVSSDQNIDDSLTSLAWLQNLNVMKLAANAAASSSSSSVTAAGQSRFSTISSTLPGSGNQQLQRSTSRPTGAVQPIQQQQPRRLSTTSTSIQRLGVDPNDVLDMTHLASSSSLCRKSQPEMTSLHQQQPQTCGSPTGSSSCGDGSPSLQPPRLSPQPPTSNADCAAGCGGGSSSTAARDGRPSPSPPALQAVCGADETGSGCSKPNHSYATLICMAMNDAEDSRVTLAGIYGWIADNFPYYRTADPSWQNSIRHNLSLNKCFQRVQRDKSDPPGKGSYWTLNPDFHQLVDRDLFRKRSRSPSSGVVGNQPAGAKRPCRRRAQTDNRQQQQQQATRNQSTDEYQLQSPYRRLTGNDVIFDNVYVSESSQVPPQLLASAADAEDFDSFDLADALDMSWSAILGRDIDEQHQTTGAPASESSDGISGRASRHSASSSRSATGSSGSATTADDDLELEELIRACSDADPAMHAVTDCRSAALIDDRSVTATTLRFVNSDDEQTGFGGSLDVDDDDMLLGGGRGDGNMDDVLGDPLDLTVYGVRLRPPDWWSTLDIVDDIDRLSAAASGIDDGRMHHHHQDLQRADEAPHPWAENRDRARDGRRVSAQQQRRLFDVDDAGLTLSFDAGDNNSMLMMTSSSSSTPTFDPHRDIVDEF